MRFSDSVREDGDDSRRQGRHGRHSEVRVNSTDLETRESQDESADSPSWTPPTMPPIKASMEPPTAIQRAVSASSNDSDSTSEVIDVRDQAIYPGGDAPRAEVIPNAEQAATSRHFFDSDIHAPSVDDFFGNGEAKEVPTAPVADTSRATRRRSTRTDHAMGSSSTPGQAASDALPTPKNAPTGASADDFDLRYEDDTTPSGDAPEATSPLADEAHWRDDTQSAAAQSQAAPPVSPLSDEPQHVPSPLDTQMIATSSTPSWRRPARAIVAPADESVIDPALAKDESDPETRNLQIVAAAGSKERKPRHHGSVPATDTQRGATLTHTDSYIRQTPAVTGERGATEGTGIPAHAEPAPISSLDAERARPRQATDLYQGERSAAHATTTAPAASSAPNQGSSYQPATSAVAAEHVTTATEPTDHGHGGQPDRASRGTEQASPDEATSGARRRGRSSRWGFGAGKNKPSTGKGTSSKKAVGTGVSVAQPSSAPEGAGHRSRHSSNESVSSAADAAVTAGSARNDHSYASTSAGVLPTPPDTHTVAEQTPRTDASSVPVVPAAQSHDDTAPAEQSSVAEQPHSNTAQAPALSSSATSHLATRESHHPDLEIAMPGHTGTQTTSAQHSGTAPSVAPASQAAPASQVAPVGQPAPVERTTTADDGGHSDVIEPAGADTTSTSQTADASRLPSLWSQENKVVPSDDRKDGGSRLAEKASKVAMVSLVGALAGIAYASVTPPDFEASDAILVRPHMNTSPVIADTGVVLPSDNAEADLDSAMQILTSEQAEKAVLQRLSGNADVDALRQHVDIERVEGLPMIRVTADGNSAQNARNLVTVYVDTALGLHDQAVKAGAQNALSAKPSMPAEEREELQQIIDTGDVGIVPARGTNVGAVEVRNYALPAAIGTGVGAALGVALVMYTPRRKPKV